MSRTHSDLPLGVSVLVEQSLSDLLCISNPSFLLDASLLVEHLLMTPMAVEVLDSLLPVFVS